MITQSNPRAGYLAHREALDAAVQRVLDGGWYIHGREVTEFEREFAAYLGVGHAVGVANGTDAIELALRSAGVGPGDVVLTVGHTAIATVAAVEAAGATPFLVDIDPGTCVMSVESLKASIAAVRNDRRPGLRLRAILPVHLYGQMADMTAILAIAREEGLLVVEDCAQAHGARWNGRMAGTLGDAAAFSFYPTKNLGAFGDGGAMVSPDAGIADRCRLIREYGWQQRYISLVAGTNSRLDEIQAAMLRVRLRHLDAENQRRRDIAGRYDQARLPQGVTRLGTRAEATHVYHQYVLRARGRDAFRERLTKAGVGTLIHYPVPAHLQPAYAGRLPMAPGGLPATVAAAEEVVSLPMHPHLTDGDVESVVSVLESMD